MRAVQVRTNMENGIVLAILSLGPCTLPHVWTALERFLFNSPEYAPRGGIEYYSTSGQQLHLNLSVDISSRHPFPNPGLGHNCRPLTRAATSHRSTELVPSESIMSHLIDSRYPCLRTWWPEPDTEPPSAGLFFFSFLWPPTVCSISACSNPPTLALLFGPKIAKYAGLY